MTACASILCDACSRPGRCCTGFGLNVGDAETALEALVLAATTTNFVFEGKSVGYSGWAHAPAPDGAEHIWVGLPFVPLYLHPTKGWRWWCPLLGKDGRCTVYEDRPAICRDFKPGSDALCAMHTPPPSLDAVDFHSFEDVPA